MYVFIDVTVLLNTVSNGAFEDDLCQGLNGGTMR